MKRIILKPGTNLAQLALAHNLYRSAIKALAELVFNGIDAAKLRGVEPVIEIRIWKAGEHPLSPDGPAVTVLDNGTGLTDDVIDAYCRVGDSVHVGKANVHGKHGLGKLAALALGPRENGRGYYITTNTDGKETWEFLITPEVFNPEGFEPKSVSRKRIGLPKDGPFTEICVPAASLRGVSVERLLTELPNILPLSKWTVRVNGQPVQLRSFIPQIKETTPVIQALGGAVTIAFAVSKLSAPNDAVLFIDSVSGRIVGDSDDILKPVRRHIDGVLRHPRLVGEIHVPGLEADSAANREGLNADFWDSPRGEALLKVLDAYAVPKAREILGADEETGDGSLTDIVRDMQRLFDDAFGPPPPTEGPPGPPPPKDPTGGGGDGGGGNPPKPPVNPPDGPTKQEGVRINVDGTMYRLMTYPTADPGPSTVRKGKVIIINTGHPEFLRVKKENASSPRAIREAMSQWAIEAHVAFSTFDDVGEGFAEVYRIKNALMMGKKEKK